MRNNFLSRRTIFRTNNALLLLMVVCFVVPFAMRGARLSLEKTENNVKDWLPDDFRETREQEWFSRYFSGERFIVATWPGCVEGDPSLRLLAEKLRVESIEGKPAHVAPDDKARADKLAAELELLQASNDHDNWLGLNEKWLTSETGKWYYITPEGKLYRWTGGTGLVATVKQAVRSASGSAEVPSVFVTAFSSAAPKELNSPFYTNTHLLTGPLFATVDTGPDVAEELSQRGGPLWPRDTTRESLKPVIAYRRAMQRLTGTLFGPAVPEGFNWSADAFRDALPADRVDQLPADWREVVRLSLAGQLQQRFDGELESLLTSKPSAQAEVYYRVYDDLRVEPPPRQTAILITLTDLGKRHLHHVAGRGVRGRPRGRIYDLAEQAGLETATAPTAAPPPFNMMLAENRATEEPRLRLGGPPIANVSVDEEGAITLSRLVGYSLLTGLLLSFLCFRSVKVTAMVFFVSGVSACASLSMVYWLGDSNDAVMMSMPPLVYVLTLSGAIHIVNYYREEVQQGGLLGAAERAFRHGWAPCSLAALTTAIGLMSLYTSSIIPIRKFGFYAALGVLLAVVLLFAYLPSALHIFSPQLRARKKAARGPSLLERFWTGAGQWIVGHHYLVSGGCFALLLVTAFGLTRIRTSVQLLELFDREAQVIQDYGWLESNFGNLVPMELVVRVPPEMQQERIDELEASESGDPAAVPRPLTLDTLERVEAVSRVQETVQTVFGPGGEEIIGQAMSAVAFIPPSPPPANGFDPVRYKMNLELNSARDQLLGSDYYRIERDGPWEGSELWRITLRVGALKKVDYGLFVDDLREAVEPVMQAYRARHEALSAILAKRDEQQFGRIIILGRAKPSGLRREIEQVETGNVLARRAAIFNSTLASILDNASLRSVMWHDPTTGKLEGMERDPRWGEALATADCVLLVDDHPDYDLPFIREHSEQLIDARDWIRHDVTPAIVDGVPHPVDPGPLQVVYTGVVPVVYKAQRALLNSLVQSILWAFVLIGCVMILLLNPGSGLGKLAPSNIASGAIAGSISMLPNIFPVVIIFGAMGYIELAVDIGTMMTASVAMGVAVDDTIHFLSWFRDSIRRGATQQEAVLTAYRRVGPAMTQTTVVGGLGLFVFALSTFTPTQRFGTLMLVLLVAALVGDLIFLPALLAGPLGRFFRARRQQTASSSHPESRDDKQVWIFSPSEGRRSRPSVKAGVDDHAENASKSAG